ANLASKRGARILAEQSLVEARVQLGTVMGLDGAQIMSLPPTATAFPTPRPDTIAPSPVAALSASAIARLVDSARTNRSDLATQRAGIRAAELELRELRSATAPRLDLVMSLGYQGYTEGPGVSHFVSPLYRDVKGLNASVQFRYDAFGASSAARGPVIREQALLEQQRGALRDVERSIVTDVETSVAGVRRAAVALEESQQAVELYRKTVENEQRKLQLGMNTLFDVLNAEDALTNAVLNAANNQRAYAVSVATLRAATGTLVDIVAGVPRVRADRLLEPVAPPPHH
ncbi:MAG TPA: TolC family protein, partial [Gemmatimonadaceae bacterium]